MDDPIEPCDLDHMLVHEEDVPVDISIDPDIGPDGEDTPFALDGEQEDNMKAPATEKVTTSKEENEEVYHQERYRVAWNRIRSLTNTVVIEGKKDDKICWQVVESCTLENFSARKCMDGAGLKDINKLIHSVTESLINFWPGDLWQQWSQMNMTIRNEVNQEQEMKKIRPIREVERAELLTFIALIIGASNQSVRGCNLWHMDTAPTLSSHTDYSNFMSRTRFWQIKQVVPFMMEDQSKDAKKNDDWWRARDFIDGFNQRRVDMINSSLCYVLDESMSPMMPRYVGIVSMCIIDLIGLIRIHISLTFLINLFHFINYYHVYGDFSVGKNSTTEYHVPVLCWEITQILLIIVSI